MTSGAVVLVLKSNDGTIPEPRIVYLCISILAILVELYFGRNLPGSVSGESTVMAPAHDSISRIVESS